MQHAKSSCVVFYLLKVMNQKEKETEQPLTKKYHCSDKISDYMF